MFFVVLIFLGLFKLFILYWSIADYGQPSWSTKESKMQYLDAISKTQNNLCHFQGKPFNITVIQVYAPPTNTEEAEVERFYEDLQDLPELT